MLVVLHHVGWGGLLGSRENRTQVKGAEIGSFAKGSRRELVTWAPKVGLDSGALPQDPNSAC